MRGRPRGATDVAADRHPECQGGDKARRVKGCMDRAQKGKGRDGQRADCRVDGRQGGAGAALWAGTATAGQPTSDSRCPWAGRREARRGAASTARQPGCGYGAARTPASSSQGAAARHGTGQPRSRRRAGAARVVHIERGTDTHPAQDMHGSKADGVAPKAKKVVRGGRGHSKNAAGQQARPPREHFAVGGPFHSEGQEPHRSARGAVQLRRKHMPAGQGEAPHACARKMPPRVHGHGQATWHPCRRE